MSAKLRKKLTTPSTLTSRRELFNCLVVLQPVRSMCRKKIKWYQFLSAHDAVRLLWLYRSYWKSRLANLILLAVLFFFDFCFALFTTAVVVVHQIHGHELCEINNSYTIEYDRVRPIKLIASMTINKFTCGSLTLFTYFGCDELEKKVKFLRSAAWTSHNQFFCRFDQTHIFSPTEFETPQWTICWMSNVWLLSVLSASFACVVMLVM